MKHVTSFSSISEVVVQIKWSSCGKAQEVEVEDRKSTNPFIHSHFNIRMLIATFALQIEAENDTVNSIGFKV